MRRQHPAGLKPSPEAETGAYLSEVRVLVLQSKLGGLDSEHIVEMTVGLAEVLARQFLKVLLKELSVTPILQRRILGDIPTSKPIPTKHSREKLEPVALRGQAKPAIEILNRSAIFIIPKAIDGQQRGSTNCRT